MARPIVPERYHQGLNRLLALADDTFKELVDALADLTIKVYPRDELISAISHVRNISSDDVGAITDAVLGLCMNRAGFDKETTVYVEDLGQSIERPLKLAKDGWSLLKNRLVQILNIKPLVTATKATSILLEYDHIFGTARILTDARPIFDVKVTSAPSAAVVVHNLCIHYQQDGGHKIFFVAMDDNDIQTLIETLDRAKVKSQYLKKTLADAGVICIETTQD